MTPLYHVTKAQKVTIFLTENWFLRQDALFKKKSFPPLHLRHSSTLLFKMTVLNNNFAKFAEQLCSDEAEKI